MRATVSEARANLPNLLDRVAGGDEVTITRHGSPVAVLVRPDVLLVRRAGAALEQAAELHELLAAAADAPQARTGLTAERAEQLVRDVRAARDRR